VRCRTLGYAAFTPGTARGTSKGTAMTIRTSLASTLCLSVAGFAGASHTPQAIRLGVALSDQPAVEGTSSLAFKPGPGAVLQYRLRSDNSAFESVRGEKVPTSVRIDVVVNVTVMDSPPTERKLLVAYGPLTIATKTAKEELAFDSEIEPVSELQKAVAKRWATIRAKQIVVTLDEKGAVSAVEGLPVTLFQAAKEYELVGAGAKDGLVSSAGGLTGVHLAMLGTATAVPWRLRIFSPGAGRPEQGSVGSTWSLYREGEGGRENPRCELVEAHDGRATIVYPAGAPKPAPGADPVENGRWVWNTNDGVLATWDGDTGHMLAERMRTVTHIELVSVKAAGPGAR
jgi:hypothetical protein